MGKILILGKGFISDHLPYDRYTKIINPDELVIQGIINKYKPDVIVNCIGRTGSPTIDWCESHKSETVSANIAIPLALSNVAEKHSIQLICFGSGCVYYGKSPNNDGYKDTGWKETDFANPSSFYSKTKYAADLILNAMPNTTILRLRMPVSSSNHPRNLLNKLLTYNKILEEPNSITFVDDLVNAVSWAIKNSKKGIYHITNPNPITHSVLLEEYKRYNNYIYEKISKEQLNAMTLATRSNCILDSSKIIKEGFKFEDINVRIHNTIKKFVENIKLNKV